MGNYQQFFKRTISFPVLIVCDHWNKSVMKQAFEIFIYCGQILSSGQFIKIY
jgi:hypothetical protein